MCLSRLPWLACIGILYIFGGGVLVIAWLGLRLHIFWGWLFFFCVCGCGCWVGWHWLRIFVRFGGCSRLGDSSCIWSVYV